MTLIWNVRYGHFSGVSEPRRFRVIPEREHLRFAEFLRSVREKSGVSQRELARRLRQPQSYLWKIENGSRQVPFLEFLSICLALEISACEIIKQFPFPDAGSTGAGEMPARLGETLQENKGDQDPE